MIKDTESSGSNSVKLPAGAISLPIEDLLKRRVTELKECYLLLHEKHLEYKIVGRYETLQENKDTGVEEWLETKANYRWTRMRKDLTDVDMYFDNDEKMWAVNVEFGTFNQSWLHKKGEDAKKLYDTLQEYLITR